MAAIALLRSLLSLAALSTSLALAQQAPPATSPPAATPDRPLATVNGVPIKQSTFEQALKQALAKGNPDSPQLRQALKNQLIARELFVQEAAKQGLDKDPEVLAVMEEAKRSAMVQRYLQGKIKAAPVTDEQIKAHYEKIKAGAGAKEYKLRVMMLPNAPRAKEMRDQLAKGKDFAELARQWSLAPSASRGGDVGWVSYKTPAKEGETQGLPLPIAQAVEKLQKGKSTEPIEVQGRWWIVKLDDVRPTKVPSYDEAKAQIQRALNARELERATGELAQELGKSAAI